MAEQELDHVNLPEVAGRVQRSVASLHQHMLANFINVHELQNDLLIRFLLILCLLISAVFKRS